MSKVNHEHKKNVRVENAVKVLYIQLLKVIYGCMDYVLLWYYLYSKNLKSHGFMFNPYYRYIADSTIKVKQCTIAWYIDNN